MNKEKIVILEFHTGQVYILDYDSSIYEDPEDFFLTKEMEDFNIVMCEYMIVLENELQIHLSV